MELYIMNYPALARLRRRGLLDTSARYGLINNHFITNWIAKHRKRDRLEASARHGIINRNRILNIIAG